MGFSPFGFRDAGTVIDRASHDKQEVGEAIQVDDEHGFDGIRTERDDAPLGAAADRSRQMKQRAGRRPAGKNKPAQRRQRVFEPVDGLFEALDGRIGRGSRNDATGKFS